LANAREKAVAEWKDRYGWAEQVDRAAVEHAIKLAKAYQTDKVGLLQELIAEAQNDPQAAAQLRSMAARQLAAGRGQQQQPPADEMPQPDVAITDANGQVVGQTYSAEQLAKRDAFLRQQMLAEIRKEFEPVTKTVSEVIKERTERAADAYATKAMEGFSKLPGFDAHKAEIGQRLRALDLQTDDPRILDLATRAIYHEVVTPKREQDLSAKAQSELLDNLQHKAAASTSVNPGSAAPSTPKRVDSFYKLGPEAWK
jgi:hypothetical protein